MLIRLKKKISDLSFVITVLGGRERQRTIQIFDMPRS